MDSGFTLSWDENGRVGGSSGPVVSDEVICGLDAAQPASYPIIPGETIIADTDQIAAENLMHLAQDMVAQMAGYAEAGAYSGEAGGYSGEVGTYSGEAGGYEGGGVECVTEEVITDDWVQPGGQERVEVPLHQLMNSEDMKQENDDVPLPTDQDEYTAMRPWPCDFCSRRFRKKASLMNHMVAHQNDRPHGCNLCGMRYVRKSDLMNHLKTHAFVPEDEDDCDFEAMLHRTTLARPKKKKSRRKQRPRVDHDEEENGDWEHMTSARTQMWERRPPAPPAPLPVRSPTPPPPQTPPSPPSPLPPTDPRRPFVCQQCGIAFAREKALQSHSRIHGGESPLECGTCGELCWSRDGLASHTRSRHPHLAATAATPSPPPAEDDSSSFEEEMEYTIRSMERSAPERVQMMEGTRGPELFCQYCGVAFQRADLLRRHVTAAHSYKRHDSETLASDISGTEHTCDVCGETCTDALQLLAHAEMHARDHGPPRLKRSRPSANSGKTFPCNECGKTFGSRSSQQIHIRIHTGERPYGCRFCWKAFADGGTLRKHERIHTGEKPYACAVCPRAFNQRVVLREHVRSHHSAPDHRRSGVSTFSCAVCNRTLPSSFELVQHLIEHCDANTALMRQPQSGPRKYKRRRCIKKEPESSANWDPTPSPPPDRSPTLSPTPSAPSPPPTRLRHKKRARKPPPPRPKMIHSEESCRPRTKNVKTTTMVRMQQATFPLLSAEPADDLRAIMPQMKQEPEPEPAPVKSERRVSDEGGPYRCEMCSQQFQRREDLLLHVPVHI